MPVKTRLPADLFGDALMVLEFLHAFGELFDLKDEFPDGITLGERVATCKWMASWDIVSFPPTELNII